MAIKQKRTVGGTLFDLVNLLIMVIVLCTTLYPFLYILIYSVSSIGKLGTGFLLYPKGFNLDAYKTMLGVDEIPHAMLVSVLRSVIGPVGTVLVSALAAFAVSQTDLVGRKQIVRFLTVTMYFSSGLIPYYMLVTKLRLSGTFLLYIIPGLFGVFNMILIKTYMESLPYGLQESAMIEGANHFTVFSKIVFPLCKPVLVAILLFECVGQWNCYSDNMIFNSTKPDLYTLSFVLMKYISTNASSVEEARQKAQLQTISTNTLKMAMTMITVIPIMCVYPVLQKYFAKGLLIGSIKG